MTTMGKDYLPSMKILGAMLAASVLVIGAYVVARGIGNPPAVSASAESELLAEIAARDSDGDGLRDWEEVLYATDPKKSDTRGLGMNDGEAVSRGLIVPAASSHVSTASSTPSSFDPSLPVPAKGTITRAVAERLIANYTNALRQSPTGTLSDEEVRALSDRVLDELNESLQPAPDFRSRQTIVVSGSGPEAMRAYAVSAEAVFRSYGTTAEKTDIQYLKIALEENDTSVFKHILSISKMYQDTATGLAALPVPQEVAGDHLMLINAMARLSKITADFTRSDSDPFATLLVLKQYPEAMKAMGTAFININKLYWTAGVIFASGEPGSAFVGVIEKITKGQQAPSLSQP